MNILKGVDRLLAMGGRKVEYVSSGVSAFWKLLRAGRLKELEALVEHGNVLGEFQVTKFENEEALRLNEPYLIGTPFRNQLVNGGMVLMWELITAQNGRTAFSNAAAYLGVGDSTTAFAVSQTDLQASSNKIRTAMDVSYPNAPTLGVEQWRSTLTSGNGNFHWQEFALFNAAAGVTMMNRSLSDQGTKTAGQSWQLLYQITLS